MGAQFTRRKENFICSNCGINVRGTGYTNHCPHCLWSRHVDVFPGDRAATCGGLMEPIAAVAEKDGYVVVQQCVSCGHLWRNKVSPRDDHERVLSLFGRVVPDTRPPRPVKAHTPRGPSRGGRA